MAGKPPYFPFYVRDFASDGKVEAMSTEEVGAYILLLCKAWLEEPPGTIPSDDAILARWARMDPDKWAMTKLSILAPFALGPDGRFHQKRMKEEYVKLVALLQARSRGGKKGSKSRWKRDPEPPDPPPSSVITESSLSDNSDVTRAYGSGSVSGSGSSSSSKGGRGGGNASSEPALFDVFWEAYPRKMAKEAARRAWKKLAPDGKLFTTLLVALEQHKKRWNDPQYIPFPGTWLNGRRWEDEELALFNGEAGARNNGHRPDVGSASRIRANTAQYGGRGTVARDESPGAQVQPSASLGAAQA